METEAGRNVEGRKRPLEDSIEPFPKHPLFDQNGMNLLGDSANNMLPNERCGMGEEETVDSSSPGICMEDFDPNTCFDVCGQVEEDKLAESTTTFMTPSYFSSNKSRAFLSVTNGSGTMKRLRVRSIREMEQKQHKVSKGYGGGQLLFIPVHELKKTVEEKRYQKLMNECDDVSDSLKRTNSINSMEDDEVSKHREGFLWAEKYSPKHFTDLLSDDGINRTLLSWLKLWDETVFGTCSLLKDTSNTRFNNSTNSKTKKGPMLKKFKQSQWEVQDPEHFGTAEALDETRRPKQKLFLLCGPPGLGKTTLAHIVAIHAGYNVVEINASDDRSPDVFRKVLESSTEMKAVLTANSKPNCLVIDEIDGAPVAAINVLIDVIKARAKVTKGSKKSKAILSRPIICICNDQYAPSLRVLRHHAIILPVPPTVTGRLASRLLEICRQEHMNTTSSVLMALCEKTDNDIRTCLNTLQFIHRRHGEMSLGSVQSISVGKKDTQKSLLSFWKEIFKIPSAKKASIHGCLESHSTTEQDHERTSFQSQRLTSILSSAYGVGEYEKVLQGLYENYLEVKVRDPYLNIISEIQDWIIFNESLQMEVLSSQDYTLMGYLPFLSVAFHFLFAVSSGHRVKYPNSNFEAFQTLQKNQQILSSLSSDVEPSVRRNLSIISSVDFIPLLLNIITPTFRPVNPQLYTKWEKRVLSNVIETMISYNLTYRQEQTPEGQYTYVMDPDIELLCSYSSLAQKRQLPYVTKQMLAREIELEKVKVESRSLEDHSPNLSPSLKPKASKLAIQEAQRKPLEIKEPIKPRCDFFGRPILPKPSNTEDLEQTSKKPISSVLSSTLWFKFNQGFSDAVKRPVRIKDLL